MVTVTRYTNAHQKNWDRWLDGSRNPCLLFYRDYMDYHADRFEDHSLLFHEEGRLVAALPANRDKDALVSHGGLTYGGMICDANMNTARMLGVFEALSGYLETAKVRSLLYKCLPHIYHTSPCEEDLFALFVHGAELARRDVSSAVFVPSARVEPNRLRGAKKSASEGVEIRPSADIGAFMDMVSARLDEKYSQKAVHSAAEMTLLTGRFPKAIRLFGAYAEKELVAGALVYESPAVAHVQYLSTNEKGRRLRALDLLLTRLLTEEYRNKRWFDLGTSTESGGSVVNETLFKQKEEFGATALCQDAYELKTGAPRRPLKVRRNGTVAEL